MKIVFRDIRGSKVVSFYNDKILVCKLYSSKFQPDLGYRLQYKSDIWFHPRSHHQFTYDYKTIRDFRDANSGIDYVTKHWEELTAQAQAELDNARSY